MTVYIIDPSQPRPPTYGDYDHALDLVDGDTVLLSAGASIEAYGTGASGIYGGHNTTLLIDGSVTVASAPAISTHGTIIVGKSGFVGSNSLSPFGIGVEFTPKYDNPQPSVLDNSGTIYGVWAGVFAYDGIQAIINNSGTIIGGDIGIVADNMQLVINNTGLIKGNFKSIGGYDFTQAVISNKGHIEGDIWLSSRDDVYDGRGGTIDGEILLWEGDDVAYGGDGSETFFLGGGHNFVDGGAGIDTLKFRVDEYQGWVPITVDLRNTGEQQVNTVGQIAWNTICNIENLVGNLNADTFIGNDAANVFVGDSGNDSLDGQGGNDVLNGGVGNDSLTGGEGTDMAIYSGKRSDYTIATGQDGSVTITDLRSSGDGIDRLTGVEFALFSDTIATLPAPSIQTPVAPPSLQVAPPVPPALANLTLKGGTKADILIGGAGHDTLNGGLGKDKLTGGEGPDVFAFTTKIGKTNIDRVVDFNCANDSIWLDNAVFKKLGKGTTLKPGKLNKKFFTIGDKAKDKNDYLVYNKKTGVLSYDADGSGTKHEAVKFAILKAKIALSADDIWIV